MLEHGDSEPDAAPIESTFISAAGSEITSERNTTNSVAPASTTTIAMNTDSSVENTSAKSSPTAVAPPTKCVALGLEPVTS